MKLKAVSFEIDLSFNVNTKATAISKVVSDKPHTWRWRIKETPKRDTVFKGDGFSKPPENFDELHPIDYFKMFWTDNITNLLVEQTNLYSAQVSGTSISTSSHETERFLGFHVLMDIIKLPVYDMYWAAETRYAKIADVMSNKRYKQLRKENPANKNDMMFKIRPILEGARAYCIKTEPEEVQSTDKQIIPAKTKSSEIRQCNPQKPKKWGFKMFVRAGQYGFMYDVLLYSGKNSANKAECENVVWRLCEGIPRLPLCFCALPLLLKMKFFGILTTDTIRANLLSIVY